MAKPHLKGGVGWLVIVVGAAVLYFIFKKSATVGGVTATPPAPYGPGSGGLYSQVG